MCCVMLVALSDNSPRVMTSKISFKRGEGREESLRRVETCLRQLIKFVLLNWMGQVSFIFLFLPLRPPFIGEANDSNSCLFEIPFEGRARGGRGWKCKCHSRETKDILLTFTGSWTCHSRMLLFFIINSSYQIGQQPSSPKRLRNQKRLIAPEADKKAVRKTLLKSLIKNWSRCNYRWKWPKTEANNRLLT